MKDSILHSWSANADNWIQLIRNSGLESRKITNPAIIEAVMNYHPSKILDIGCGEGWLTRTLAEKGLEAMGVDGTHKLIEEARKSGIGQYEVLSYEELERNSTFLSSQNFDAVIFNFSLYEESISGLLASVAKGLGKGGLLFIQTLHPDNIEFREKGSGQWMDNAWKGLPEIFTMPHKWFARSEQGWQELLKNSGFQLKQTIEPGGETPLSLILVSEVRELSIK